METFDLIAVLRDIFSNFNASIFLGLTAVLYLVIQLLRGKLVVGDKQIKVPWLTDKFNALAKEAKTWIILGLFGLVGIFIGLSESETITFWSILDSFFAGIASGAATIGLRSGVKQGISGLGKLKNSIKENRKKS